MKKSATVKVFVFVAAIILALRADAQKNNTDKAFAQADKYIENNKPEEAEKILKSLAEKNPHDGKVWDKLVQTQMVIYQQKQKYDNLFGSNFTITEKDSTGTKIANDSLALKLAAMLAKIKPSDIYLTHIINTCRVACCQTNEAVTAPVIIRMYRIDSDTTGNNPEAVKQFNLAEREFQKKNYTSAANYYKKAIEIDPSYYKANLYLGVVYYFTRHFDLAIQQFKKAVQTRPGLLEPRKYLADGLMESHQYEEAYNVCVDAMGIYPDIVMSYKLEDAARAAGFKCDLHWINREALPNAKEKQDAEKDDIAMPTVKKSPWVYYTQALDNVKTYCDDKGILAANPVTKQKYLEVYSWEQMLAKSNDPSLDFARKMMDKGFLDCYVFISCFHYDCYQQFKDFVAANPGRVRQYMELLKTM